MRFARYSGLAYCSPKPTGQPRPSADEMKTLGAQVVYAREAKQALLEPGLEVDSQEYRDLITVIQKGESARTTLIETNVGLAIRFAAISAKRSGQEIDDVIGDAMIGLVDGVDRYDPVRYETKFSTFVVWRIRAWIARGTLNRPASKNLSDGRRILWGHGIYMNDEFNRDPEDTATSRSITPVLAPDHASRIENHEIKMEISHLVSILNPNEKYVVTRRFDLDGNGILSMKDIAYVLGLTKQRVWQIEQSAFEKIRKLSDRLQPRKENVA